MTFSFTPENIINLIFIAAGIGVCGLTFLHITASVHLQKDVKGYFQVFFGVLIFYISAHLARQLMEGQPGRGIHTALNAVTFTEMLAAGVMTHMLSLLVMVASNAGRHMKRIQAALGALLALHTLVLAAGLFTDLVFYFDDGNIYHRAPGYLLSNACPVGMILIDIFLMVRCRDNIYRRLRTALWAYMVAPVIAIILQSFTYGIQFIIFAAVGSSVFLFAVIIRDLNEKYMLQETQASRLSAELSMAKDIQASQLPRLFPAFPNRSEFDIYASMTPAKEVGGDFYDFFLVDPDHIALVMADVSGKGVPAALFMMVARVLLKARVQGGDSPGEALTYVNNQLCQSNDPGFFVTVWLAILEISTGKGVAANAGHEHPALRRAGGAYELVTYRHSPAVAVMEGIRFAEHSFELRPGDSVFVYTDGVAEATDARKELFGTERMLKALNRNPDAPPQAVLSNVMEGIESFVADAEQFDDITMLCLTYRGPAAGGEA